MKSTKKQIIIVFAILTMSLVLSCAFVACDKAEPDKEPSEGLEYSLNSDENGYTVTGIGTCTDKELIIPSEYNAKPVTSIGYSAFSDTGLTSVTIPDSVTSIGYEAFCGCTGLTRITVAKGNTKYHSAGNCLIETESKTLIAGCKNSIIPTDDSVTSIGGWAFYNCTELTSVTIPDSVTSIGYSAFRYCTGLTSVTIPDNVTSIGWGAFYNTLWYDNQPDGLVYAGKVAYKYKGTMPSNTSIVLREGTLGIADSAFSGCTELTSVTIPDSVTSIGSYAFESCTGLTTVNWNAIACTSAGSLNSPIFYNCSNLATVNIEDNVKIIPSYAFYGCTGLTSVTIPDSVTSIGDYAFYGCTGLTKIIGPSAVVSTVAKQCESNSFEVVITSGTSIGDDAFAGCTGLTSVTIGDSVTSIDSYAFYGCIGLTSITIPDSVTSIGDWAFYGCTGLTSVTFKGTKAQWNAISKGDYWKDNVPATQVGCTDGTVSI